jgi:hypothetical protein
MSTLAGPRSGTDGLPPETAGPPADDDEQTGPKGFVSTRGWRYTVEQSVDRPPRLSVAVFALMRSVTPPPE